jgi:hypothetical protein
VAERGHVLNVAVRVDKRHYRPIAVDGVAVACKIPFAMLVRRCFGRLLEPLMRFLFGGYGCLDSRHGKRSQQQHAKNSHRLTVTHHSDRNCHSAHVQRIDWGRRPTPEGFVRLPRLRARFRARLRRFLGWRSCGQRPRPNCGRRACQMTRPRSRRPAETREQSMDQIVPVSTRPAFKRPHRDEKAAEKQGKDCK